jgi:hypothetical protein
MPRNRVAVVRGRLGMAVKAGDQKRVDELRRELNEAVAEAYIQRLIDSAPPLTQEQRDRLARLLRTGERSDAA